MNGAGFPERRADSTTREANGLPDWVVRAKQLAEQPSQKPHGAHANEKPPPSLFSPQVAHGQPCSGYVRKLAIHTLVVATSVLIMLCVGCWITMIQSGFRVGIADRLMTQIAQISDTAPDRASAGPLPSAPTTKRKEDSQCRSSGVAVPPATEKTNEPIADLSPAVGPDDSASHSQATGAPEIFSVKPDRGWAGETIRIAGVRLGDTKQVLFNADNRLKETTFHVVSDKQLDVVVPEIFVDRTEVTLVVVTPWGVTVGVPPSVVQVSEAVHRANGRFLHVLKGGALTRASGTLFVEAGGVAEDSSAGLQFIKADGVLVSDRHSQGVVYHEPGAILTRTSGSDRHRDTSRQHVIEVPEIKASLEVEPFLIQSPPQATGEAKSVPHIETIEPQTARSGGTVRLLGSGFLQTNAVWFAGRDSRGVTPAGFRLISDREIQVQVPQAWGEQVVVVANRKGMTFTLHKSGPISDHSRVDISRVARGVVATSGRGAFLVEDGGLVTARGNLFFVKRGGRITSGEGAAVFYEPGADIPADVLRKDNCREVPLIEPSNPGILFTALGC